MDKIAKKESHDIALIYKEKEEDKENKVLNQENWTKDKSSHLNKLANIKNIPECSKNENSSKPTKKNIQKVDGLSKELPTKILEVKEEKNENEEKKEKEESSQFFLLKSSKDAADKEVKDDSEEIKIPKEIEQKEKIALNIQNLQPKGKSLEEGKEDKEAEQKKVEEVAVKKEVAVENKKIKEDKPNCNDENHNEQKQIVRYTPEKSEKKNNHYPAVFVYSPIHSPLRILKSCDFKKFLNDKGSEELITKYGPYFVSNVRYLQTLASKRIPVTFIERHNFSPHTRTRMIDWMIEIIAVFDKRPQVFFQAVNILDHYIISAKEIIMDSDIHLLGIGCLFIACKYEEVYSFEAEEFVKKVSHDRYNIKDLLDIELKIMKTIDPSVLLFESVFEFLTLFFYDFYANNMKMLHSENEITAHSEVRKTAFYFARLVMHYEQFYEYLNNELAIGCILAATFWLKFRVPQNFSDKQKSLYSDWCGFLINNNISTKKVIVKICSKIIDSKVAYESETSLNKSLNRFFPLNYDKLKNASQHIFEQ